MGRLPPVSLFSNQILLPERKGDLGGRENLDDFIWIESKGEYHHEDDCVCCDECGTNILLDDAMCSEVTEEYYCCKECMEKAENEFKRKNWHYSEYDDEKCEFS